MDYLGENSEEVVKSLVLEHCDNYLKQVPIELHEKLVKKLPNQMKLDCKSNHKKETLI